MDPQIKGNGKCAKVTNGFVCDVTIDDLMEIRSRYNLDAHSIIEDGRSKVVFTDKNGFEIAVATRNIGSKVIRMFSTRNLL